MNIRANTILTIAIVAATGVCFSACTRTREVERVDPGTVVDVDYRFNDTDARQVWQGMSEDALFRQWTINWTAEHAGNRPIIIVGPIKNQTDEYIETKLFTRNFEREMLNSGRVRIVSARDDRGELRDERLEGQEWNSPETRKIVKNELGADLMLLGDILQVKDRSIDGKKVVNYYQVNLDLTNIETNEKVWIGSVEVKKVSTERGG